jgi:hypothetical protein
VRKLFKEIHLAEERETKLWQREWLDHVLKDLGGVETSDSVTIVFKGQKVRKDIVWWWVYGLYPSSGRWIKSINLSPHNIIHHHQNLLEFIYKGYPIYLPQYNVNYSNGIEVLLPWDSKCLCHITSVWQVTVTEPNSAANISIAAAQFYFMLQIHTYV